MTDDLNDRIERIERTLAAQRRDDHRQLREEMVMRIRNIEKVLVNLDNLLRRGY